MSDGWAPGDLAECIRESTAPLPPWCRFSKPKVGDVLLVSDVYTDFAFCLGCLQVHPVHALGFVGKSGTLFPQSYFRKVQSKGEDHQRVATREREDA